MEKLKDEMVYDLIQGYPIYQKEFAKKYDISERQVRRLIRDLRFEGYPIISGNEGYWIAAGDDEIKYMINRLASQIKAHGELIQAMKVGDKKTCVLVIAGNKNEYNYYLPLLKQKHPNASFKYASSTKYIHGIYYRIVEKVGTYYKRNDLTEIDLLVEQSRLRNEVE